MTRGIQFLAFYLMRVLCVGVLSIICFKMCLFQVSINYIVATECNCKRLFGKQPPFEGWFTTWSFDGLCRFLQKFSY